MPKILQQQATPKKKEKNISSLALSNHGSCCGKSTLEREAVIKTHPTSLETKRQSSTKLTKINPAQSSTQAMKPTP